MLHRCCRTLFVLLLVLPLAAGFCSEEQTESYLAAGTQHTFTAKQVDYAIVIDRSGSMEGVKIETVKAAANDLIDRMRTTDRGAIISFNYEAQLHNPLTNDHGQLAQSIEGISASFSTKYAPPLQLAQQELQASRNEKALIFLSDGKSDYAESQEEILNITNELAADGVCILTISYALGGEESPLLTAMADVGASYGCGEHFIASEQGTELEEVFSRIYETLSSSEAIALQPSFSQSGYAFTFFSAVNGKPVPGSAGNACVDEPSFYLSVYRDSRLVRTYTKATGAFSLPPGNYTYKATAVVRCGGECGFIGTEAGEVTVGGACSPGYQELATYITGETQRVQITQAGFSPRSIAGRQGTLVVWENTDSVPHRLASEFFDETLGPGETFTYVIQNLGTLVYTDPERNITASVSPIQGTGNDILLIIDESGSMKGAGIAEARIAAQKFFTLLSPADRGALITFSESAYLIQDFTSDRSKLHEGASAIRAEGATNYLTALQLAEKLRPVQQAILIFMSDGVPTDPEGEAAILEASDRLHSKDWCIMTVGFGKEGIAARSILTRIAGEDQCSAFLYASGGNLSQTFGTIYQLSKSQHDLAFAEMRIPSITLQPRVAVQTTVLGKTGKPVPGTTDGACAPDAVVQARTGSDTTDLLYSDGAYRGELLLEPGFNTVAFVASVSAQDEPGRAFVGATSAQVIYVPLYIALLTVLLAVTLIYLVFFRRSNDVA